MTTSYELSLRLKELGAVQEGAEFYWANPSGGHGEEHVIFHEYIRPTRRDARAWGLGDLIREIGNGLTISLVNNEYHFAWHDLSKSALFFDKSQIPRIISKFNTTPEEAAGELLAEILKQKQQRA